MHELSEKIWKEMKRSAFANSDRIDFIITDYLKECAEKIVSHGEKKGIFIGGISVREILGLSPKEQEKDKTHCSYCGQEWPKQESLREELIEKLKELEWDSFNQGMEKVADTAIAFLKGKEF